MKDEDEYININDTYNIRKDIALLRKLIDAVELDITAFLSHKKVKSKAVKARAKLRNIKKEFIPSLEKKILKTKQDYDSDYS